MATRIASYARSSDGVHWVWDSYKAYDPEVVRHPDGTIERWNHLERPKVRREQFGLATHLNLATIDCPKNQCESGSVHNSKSLVVPLVVGRCLAMLSDQPITPQANEIRLQIKAERAFGRPGRFGATTAVLEQY